MVPIREGRHLEALPVEALRAVVAHKLLIMALAGLLVEALPAVVQRVAAH